MVLAFHAGRLGASLSFMGKGVTYYSSLCLVQLTHEMSAIDPGQVIIHHSLKEQCHEDFAVLGQFCAIINTLRL